MHYLLIAKVKGPDGKSRSWWTVEPDQTRVFAAAKIMNGKVFMLSELDVCDIENFTVAPGVTVEEEGQ